MLASTWRDLLKTCFAGQYVLSNVVDAGEHQAEFLAAPSENADTLVSIVFIEPEPGEIEQQLAAITRARQLHYANLLRVIDGGECVHEGTRVVYIVTEAAQGSLAEAIAASPQPDARDVLSDLLPPLAWLHSQNLVYRSLDPETVVRADGHWKLADLSQVHAAGQFTPAESAGRSAPPEAAAGNILPAWDAWSLGMLLRDVLGSDTHAAPSPFDAIIRGTQEPDPQRRLSIAEIERMLKPAASPQRAAEPPLAISSAPAVPSRSRLLVVTLATAAIVAILLFVLLRPQKESAPAPAPPIHATPPQPAAPASQVPKLATPRPQAPAGTPTVAPAQHLGLADYFSDQLDGHLTASGERFSIRAMSAATRQFPLGSRLRITNLKNGRSVTVRVNDRGAARHGFIVTVTRLAAEELGFVKAGSARVKIQVVR